MGNQSGGNTSTPRAIAELEEFLIAAINGDEKAFEMIWKSLNPRISKYVASQSYGSGIDYEEVVSETWISVARGISKFDGEFPQFKSWVYSIARNRIVDAVRKGNRQVKSGGEISEFEFEDSKSKVDSGIESDESVKEIVKKIKKLPEAQAEVIMLRIVGDLDVNEVARALNKSENAVRVLCSRGLETLRGELKEGRS